MLHRPCHTLQLMEWREIKQYSMYYKNINLGFTECKVKKIKQIYIKKTMTYAFTFETKGNINNFTPRVQITFPPPIDLF